MRARVRNWVVAARTLVLRLRLALEHVAHRYRSVRVLRRARHHCALVKPVVDLFDWNAEVQVRARRIHHRVARHEHQASLRLERFQLLCRLVQHALFRAQSLKLSG